MQHSLQALCVEMRARSCRFSAGERWSAPRTRTVASRCAIPSSSPPWSMLVVVTPARAAWRPPVHGSVTRGFDAGRSPYEGGHHRGVDLAAPPGSVARAPCSGRVVVAGRVGTSGRVVTLLCGRWRVTQMPLATVAVRRGSVAARGAAVGTVARSRAHVGLHLGVRRDGARFGYVDPLRFLRGKRPDAPTLVGRRGPRPRAGPRWSLPRGSNPPPVATPARCGFESGPRRRSRAVARLGRACAGARRCGRAVARGSNTPRPRAGRLAPGGSLSA